MGGRAGFFEVEILDWETKKQLCFLDKVEPNATIREIRLMFHKLYPRWYPARQSIKLDPKGKSLRDEEILQHLPVGTTATLYFKDLGPQIGWTTVFLIEYTGPLFIYFVFYFRMTFVYGLDERFTSSPHPVVNLACICHSFHYIKRLIETVFVHRFSRGTMPLRNIVKNCLYYWGFAAWLAYYINHPLYTPPSYGKKQINFAVIMFLLCEAGNFSIHVALSDLRRNGKNCIIIFQFCAAVQYFLQLLCFRKDLILGGDDICQLTAVGTQAAQHCKDWILREIRQCKDSDIRLLNNTYLTVIFIVLGWVVLGAVTLVILPVQKETLLLQAMFW
ncbi:very-long-chain enoyl-CoA reductase-like isoform X4 [Passer domesticus]|uniref:very-long-chain enoyl-CoA reductase-like isoform X4 n=1 Tax=Passer domesticus TaxID=48849 RepID=UPI0030FE9F52